METERFDLRTMRCSNCGLLAFYSKYDLVARMTSSTPHPDPPGKTEAIITRVLHPEREEDIRVIEGMR